MWLHYQSILKYCKKGKKRCVNIYDRSKDNGEKGRRVVGLSKFDFRNSATLRSLLQIPLFDTFSSAQDGCKNQPKIFLELSVSLETKNLPYRDSCKRFFPSNFFFMNRPDSTVKYMPKIAEMKL
jgi:hypothetical protein